MSRFVWMRIPCLLICIGMIFVASTKAEQGKVKKDSNFQAILLTHPKQGQTLIEDRVGIQWRLVGFDEKMATNLVLKLDGQDVISVSYKMAGRILYLPKRVQEGNHEVEIVLTLTDHSTLRDSVSFRYEKSRDAQMVLIPKGTFMMGCSPGDNHCKEDESPPHEVSIDAFYMDRTEVTNWQYQQCVYEEKCNPSYYHKNLFWTGPNHPVVAIGWGDADTFCRWKGGQLPTEAQWEYAARAGTTKERYGDLSAIAWHKGNADNRTHQVGQKEPNGFGLYDMLGNVWEWCQDYYHSTFYQQSPAKNPSNQQFASERVLRGGGWYFDSANVRVSNRSHIMESELGSNGGFRCVKPAP